MSDSNDAVKSARTLLLGGGALVAAGIGVAGTASPTFGGVVVVVGWLVLVLAIHRFGRARAA